MTGQRVNSGGNYIVSLIFAGILLCPGWAKNGIADADQKAEVSVSQEERGVTADGETSKYHTLLAGEPVHTVFKGKTIDVPAMDRARVTAVSLGGVLYFPKQGETSFTPIGAFYLKRVWAESRTRNVISVFVNDLEYDKASGI